ncbi:MAG TPA: non-canonical purine NTP pyrophosphatase [Acidobacteriota bacterium]|nr:non-canonical purine NTP pyrophosphatase [Acidobacteriota bacterium]
MSPELKLLIASTNPGKILEIMPLLFHLSLRLVGLDELGSDPGFVEDGETFADNSASKALHYHLLHGLPTVADDSGLVVSALGGEPGVRSSRFLGEETSYPEKMARILEMLRKAEKAGGTRAARFTCALSLAVGGRVAATIEKHVFGNIAEQPRGDHGFGYDPIFYSPALGKTFGESVAAEKDRISHRAQALRSLAALLESHEKLRGELGISSCA